MSASTARVGAVIRKELAEFRRNRLIVVTAAVLPVVFLILPTVSILNIKAGRLSATLDTRVHYSLFLPLLVPVFVPAVMSAYSVVGEREQGTLEPVLTTPVGRAELVIGKAAAVFLPADTWQILLDGKPAGSIADDGAARLPAGPGHHALRLSSGRCTNPERSFGAADGQVVSFTCHAPLIWPQRRRSSCPACGSASGRSEAPPCC